VRESFDFDLICYFFLHLAAFLFDFPSDILTGGFEE